MYDQEKLDKVFFDENFKSLCYYAYTFVDDFVLAEDFVQDAFIAYYRNKDVIKKDNSTIKAYLYTTIKNSIINWSRRNKVEERYWRLNKFVEFDDKDFENAIIESEVLSEINKIILELPRACKEIFELSYFEGLPNQEIADKLEVSINTVKTQKRRGLAYVRSKLNPEYFLIFTSFIFFK